MNREAFGVSLEITGWIKSLSVEHRPGCVVDTPVRVTNLFHGLFIDIRAHDLLGDLLRICSSGRHSPTAELCNPPLRVGPLRIVTVSLAEMHGRVVSFGSAI